MPHHLVLKIVKRTQTLYIYIYIYIYIRTRYAGHCWRSRDELISDVLLWTPTHGRAKAGRPARTYIQQCEDTGYCPEDLPRAMNDREKWRERVRDIRATSTTWWWWWYISKVGDRSRGRPEGSLFNSYHTEVQGRALLLSLDCSTLLLIRTLYCWVVSKEVSSTIFESLVWRDLGLNPNLPDHWRTLYPLDQWAGWYIY